MINLMVPIDLFYPPILATFTHHIINYLPILEYNIHNWLGANYISFVKYLGDINFIDYFTNNNLKDCLDLLNSI